jgi:aspartyl/glutamyl-tRNA(Asn/Gln) amidotransferase C subunit
MVTREEAAQVAKLARLQFSDDELSRLAEQLNSILSHMDALQGVSLESAEGTGVVDWPAPARTDVVAPDPLAFPPAGLSRSVREGFFTVPRLAALDQDAPGQDAADA